MEAELESLHKNQVWELSELFPGRKAVRSKLVFKRKDDADGNVKRCKAKPIVQGYKQKYGIDYDETLCPVVRFESVGTLIALAAKQKLQIHVSTAFINGELKVQIYMKQPQQSEEKGTENLVCKLKRSIYG